MPKLQYVGQSHFREISAANFTSIGAEGQKKILVARHDVFPEQNPNNVPTEVEVSDEAANWLLANESSDWKVVEDAPASDASASASTDSASGASRAGKK